VKGFRWNHCRGLAAVMVLVLSACSKTEERQPIQPKSVVVDEIPFVESAQAASVAPTYRNGEEAGYYSILESRGGGIGWVDYDQDGRLDIVAPQGGDLQPGNQMQGLPTVLLRNNGSSGFSDVGEVAGFNEATLYSHGVAIADFDNDGFSDVLITGYGPTQLWQNLGDGTFRRLNNWIGQDDRRWSSSAGWADFDNDGNIDLFVVRYVDWSFDNNPYCGSDEFGQDICPPREFQGLPDSIFRNRGDGTFEDISSAGGLRQDGKGLGVVMGDFDVDGDVDIYVANDTVENFLYQNDGMGNFTERGLVAGVSLDDEGVPNGSMGVELCDVNRDSLPDLWVANYEREAFALYRGEGDGQFLHVSRRYGIASLGGLFVGFGTACRDFNGDGFVDIAVANGHVIKFPRATPRKQVPLFLALEGDRFRRLSASPETYFGKPHEGRGLAAGDFDNDGDLDLAISNLNEPLALLENQFPITDRQMCVTLVGTRSNRGGVGARVGLFHDSERVAEAQVVGGGSYLSHHDQRVHLTWPQNAASAPRKWTIRVWWPSGIVDDVVLDRDSLGGHCFRIVESLESLDDGGA
jgi:hypothetical protein